VPPTPGKLLQAFLQIQRPMPIAEMDPRKPAIPG